MKFLSPVNYKELKVLHSLDQFATLQKESHLADGGSALGTTAWPDILVTPVGRVPVDPVLA